MIRVFLISRALSEAGRCIIITVIMEEEGRGKGGVSLEGELPPVDPVEFLGRLCIVLGILPSDGETHGVSPSDVTSNHPLVGNIFPNLPPQVSFDLQTSQGVFSSLGSRAACHRLWSGR